MLIHDRFHARIEHVWSTAILATLLLFATGAARGQADSAATAPPQTIQAFEGDLQQILDAAPPHSVIEFNRNEARVLSAPLEVRKPLTLRGLNLQLPEGLGSTPLLIVEAEGVSITDFELRGNGESVPQSVRAPLMMIRGGQFRVERGLFLDSSKDGIKVAGGGTQDRDIDGGVIRDIIGHRNIRDLVSISGGGKSGFPIRNILVENVRATDSTRRGAVEVSDGAENITVRKVYAERCVYAIDVQDHESPGQTNTNVLIEDITAVDCTNALRTANSAQGHSNLTIRGITSVRCTAPLLITYTRNLLLEQVRVIEHPKGEPPVFIAQCEGVTVRDVVIENSGHDGTGLLLLDSHDVLVDGLSLSGEPGALTSALTYRTATAAAFSGLRIHNVYAKNLQTGILLEKADAQASLNDVLITGNLATVVNQFSDTEAIVSDNLAPSAASPHPLPVLGKAWKRHPVRTSRCRP